MKAASQPQRDRYRICLIVLLIALLIGLFPNSQAQAALADAPIAWSSFSFSPVTYNGGIISDYESSSDPSRGSAAVNPSNTDISSCSANGYLPGSQPSFQYAYYDAGTPAVADDHLALRMRLNGTTLENSQVGMDSGHWYILVDVDNDGWKEFAIDIDGTVNANKPDRVYLLYNNNASNNIAPRSGAQRAASDTLGSDEIGVWYAAGPAATGTAQTNNHTRVLTATPTCYGSSEYWLDVQLPISAFNVGGTQLLSKGTPARFIISTSASATDPLQKDWMLKLLSDPIFSDPWGPIVTATKRDVLLEDLNHNGLANPGDVLRYDIVITNTGLFAAEDVTFHDVIGDGYLIFSDNLVTTGTIVKGNPGDDEVAVHFDSIPSGSSTTISFRVTIRNPLPDGVEVVSNQGIVSGSNFVSVPTDDPRTSLGNDPTTTPVTAIPLVEPYKTYELTTDADLNGVPSPGDTITYTVTIENSGDMNASAVVFTDTPDIHSTLVNGSVATSRGSVTTGNGSGDTGVEVTVGTLPGNHGTAVIRFRVVINNPMPPGVTEISNQGFASGANFPSDPTDDPNDDAYDNPTVTPITAIPMLSATKRYVISSDADNDGEIEPGDRITYIVTITNSGNKNASGVVFQDTIDGSTTIVAGSLTTSQGLIVSETPIAINVGAIQGNGGSATISFEVEISAAVASVSNSGTVLADGGISLPTDDPSTTTPDDATVTPINLSPLLYITKTDLMAVDIDNNGVVSPGDTIEYIITINNIGNGPAENVRFTDSAPANTTLVPGSVSSTLGGVIPGADVEVNLPVLAAGAINLVTFEVEIDEPFPAGVQSIFNQGHVTSDSFPGTLDTDDPDTTASGDQTETRVYSDPHIEAHKVDQLAIDADHNGYASPGDTLLYTVTLTNAGTGRARDVIFQDTITDPNLNWAGNVDVTPDYPFTDTGNGVQVDIGDLLINTTVTITFRAQINSTPPTEISKVTNQGLVGGSNFASVPTDDPRTTLLNDATTTVIIPSEMVEPYKTWALTTDADLNSYPSPGDTITYTITIENLGNISASNVFFTDTPDPNSTLLNGSVTTSRGSVTTGNNSGDTTISINIGQIPGNRGVATVTFGVIINNPLPSGVDYLTNQGFVSGDNFATDPTDDPSDQLYDNPTVIPLTASPLLEAFKRYELSEDNDGNGLPSVDDNLTYIITIINKGNQTATGVRFTDTPDLSSALVVGSVFTSQGSVTLGNLPGHSSVDIDIGDIPGRDYNVNISFKVTITDDVDGIYNQGTIIADGGISILTDDPNTHTQQDKTYTALADSPPELHTTKSAILAIDADSNGVPGPGDTLQYIVAINNNGGSAATGIIYTDTPDANTSLVVGSVSPSGGTVVNGNNPGDATVRVEIDTLLGGAVHSIWLITYRVLIDSSLPGETTIISNQGNVTTTGPIALDKDTDDPSTPDSPDATEVTAYASPNITAIKSDTLLNDADGNGIPSPGDTLLYTIRVSNSGGTAAESVFYTDTFTDANLSLADNVSTTQGTFTTGANQVTVDIGNIGAGVTVIIGFNALIASPLMPSSVNHISNQGLVTGDNFSGVSTDDPDTLLQGDPTSTVVSPTEFVETYKTWTLKTDADHNGYPSPGDTITYNITIENEGYTQAMGVVYTDVPDANSTLVAGSVTASQGSIALGNNSGDTGVLVNVGSINGPHGTATITFDVTVNSPLPTGVTWLSNQGFVAGDNFPSDPTDDPTDESYDNPTITPLTAAPLLRASKGYTLTNDVNTDGLAGAGDTLTYSITIFNNGNQNAAGVNFFDRPDASTAIVPGSVTTSQGSIIFGSAGGDNVTINLGTIPGHGGSAHISFQVTIADPLPDDVEIVSNQGLVSGANFDQVPTDDPGTTKLDDATETYLLVDDPAPSLHITKTAILAEDADHTGQPSRGDILQYIITINNRGTGPADNVTFNDTPDTNTTLLVGSVSSTEGPAAVLTGNNAGDTSVRVYIGTLPAGQSHSVSLVTFKVRINSTLPSGTTTISNQGTVTAAGDINQLTDDPAGLPGAVSPTVTIVGPSPVTPTPAPTPPTEETTLPAHNGITSHSATVTGINSRPWEPTQINLPNITVQSASLSSSKVQPGVPVTVSAVIANRGTVNGSAKITIYVNGEQDQNYGVTVNSGKSIKLQFAVSREQPGTYSVYVNGVSAGSFSVSDNLGSNIVLVLSSICLLTALFIGIFMILRRRQNPYWRQP